MRKYTKEEMAILAQAERTLECAVYGQYYRNLDKGLAEQLWQIHHDAYEWNGRLNTNCAGCMLELVTAVGVRYFEQKKETPAKVETKDVPEAKAEKRVKVQTKKRAISK